MKQMKRPHTLRYAAVAVCLAAVLAVSLLTSCSVVGAPPAEQSTPATTTTVAPSQTEMTTATTTTRATTTTTSTVKVTHPTYAASLTADVQAQAWENVAYDGSLSMPSVCTNFAVSLLQHSYSGHGNTVTSPLALYAALAMLYNGAGGETAQELSAVLGGSPAQVNGQLGTALRRMEITSSKRTVKNAGSLWLQEGYPVKKEFLQTVVDTYGTDVFSGNMQNPGMVQQLNSWVNDKTDGRITHLLDSFPANTVMNITTTQLFVGSWQQNGQKHTDTFYETDGKETVTDFLRFDKAKNGGNLTAYISDDLTVVVSQMNGAHMLLVMPHEGSAASLLGDLRGEQLLNPASFGGSKHTNIRLYFPKFKTEADIEYRAALSAMGLSSLFSFDQADFGGLGAPIGTVALGSARVKTVFEVTADGVDAAAAANLAVILRGTGSGQKPAVPLDVKINRSFLYAVIEGSTKIPLYVGVYDTAK